VKKKFIGQIKSERAIEIRRRKKLLFDRAILAED
jgi:hypothetical protein